LIDFGSSSRFKFHLEHEPGTYNPDLLDWEMDPNAQYYNWGRVEHNVEREVSHFFFFVTLDDELIF
jgi:hypothetical protein